MIAPPDEIVELAASLLLEGTRLDTGVLAARLGISRATLFRRVGNRQALLGEALWHLAARTLEQAELAYDRDLAAHPPERLRCLVVMERFREVVVRSTALRNLLADEPVLVVRVLTDPFGHVQPRMVETHSRLITYDLVERRLVPTVPLPVLCLGLVRLGESLLYSDVLTEREVDLETATVVLDAFVTGLLVPEETSDDGPAEEGADGT